jgi:hypothetical protein
MGRRRSRARGRKSTRTPAAARPEIQSWRAVLGKTLHTLRDWARDHYGPALEAWLRERLGGAAAAAPPEDLERATDDWICAPGSAGEGASVLQVFCDQARSVDEATRAQARRWERERRRGVFVVQRAGRDRLRLWDPLEGAPLTLHLLEKLGEGELRRLGRGTVVTAVHLPWHARLVAVGVEFFGDPRALGLFREQVLEAGTPWHEPPVPAPERGREADPRP